MLRSRGSTASFARMFGRPLLTALCAAAVFSASAADNWPQFRGPNGDGQADAPNLPTRFSDDAGAKWKTAIHGRGWSSPVVWGSQVWLTTATEDGTELSVVCLDKETGKILHDKVLFRVSTPQFCHKFNSYASPTPVIEEGRVYVTFGSPGTACIDTKTGEKVWERTDFVCNHYRGAGSSPIVWKDLLIMNFDGSDFQYVAALDKKTGKTVWKTNRSVDFKDLDAAGQPTGEGDFRKAFATPTIAEVGGKPILLSSGAKAHYAYEPDTGREIWRVEEHAQHSASSRPIVGHGLAFIQTGFSKGQLLAVKLPELTKAGEKPVVLDDSLIAWTQKKSVPNKPSMLLLGDLLFMIDDGGIATMSQARTGEELWRERVQGNFSASPIAANGRIYVCSEEGKIAVLAADKEFKKLDESTLPDGFMSSPAVSGNAIYLRTRTHLYRFGN